MRRPAAYAGKKGGIWMQTIDARLQSDVWSRVRGAAASQDVEGVAPAELQRWMEEAKARWAGYRRLAAELGGRDGAVLRELAAGQAARCRQLHALYFLQTGQRLRLPPPAPAASGPPDARLRSAWQAEQRLRRQDAEAAERWPAMADAFAALSRAAAARARTLCSLLARRL